MLNISSIIHGFDITRSRQSAELNGTLYEMTHIKTGARLCWLDNGQANKLFGIAFKPVLKDVRFSKTAVFGPQRPRVAFDRIGSS